MLLKNNIIKGKDYETEYKQNKWFIDFAFVNDKIAIEIDGKQHNLPERQKIDAEKDAWLTQNGWAVYRLAWKNPTKETRKQLLIKLNQILKCDIIDDTI
jgi:very-short-patch-repair endonuclease